MKKQAAPLFVSFYTDGKYAIEAGELIKTLRKFGLEYDIRIVKDLGGWTENCGQKPSYLLKMMNLHPGRPLVWLDSDARVRQYPSLFESLNGCDFAAHWRGGVELLSGTMYWGATDVARHMLELWRDRMHANPTEWDQRGLADLIHIHRRCMVIAELPATYTAIFDAKMCPEQDWVISHHQASRRMRK
jgi:hypothetical protein